MGRLKYTEVGGEIQNNRGGCMGKWTLHHVWYYNTILTYGCMYIADFVYLIHCKMLLNSLYSIYSVGPPRQGHNRIDLSTKDTA